MNNLGAILRAKREERGLSLKDVELALSIRIKYLEALEEERFDVIPGEVYVKGFLRNYATYLDLNAEEIVQLFKNIQHPQAVIKPEPVEGEEPSEGKCAKGPGIIVLVTIGLMIIAAGYYIYSSSNPPDISKNPSLPMLPSTPVPAPQSPPTADVPSPENVVKQVYQGIKVSAKVKDECWIQVFADGKEVFEGVLQAGDVKTWEAKNKIAITLGNAAGAELTVNDKAQAMLGNPGEVVEQVYTAAQ